MYTKSQLTQLKLPFGKMLGRQKAPHQVEQLRKLTNSEKPKVVARKSSECVGLGFRRDDEVAGSEKKDEITFRRF